ncbi:hypothetical protein HMPREF1580_01341, partial [Gardnerella vaginalis JCP8070]
REDAASREDVLRNRTRYDDECGRAHLEHMDASRKYAEPLGSKRCRGREKDAPDGENAEY